MNKATSWILATVSLTLSVAAVAKDQEIDPQSGLIKAPGWELVNYQCNACHTTSIIPQNPGNKEEWRATIQWMVDTQGLWDLSDTWEPVLTYLSTNYGKKDVDMSKFRRLPLAADKLPAIDAARARGE